MKTSWVLVADAAEARILEYAGPGQRLQEIGTLSHPESQMHARELRTGGKGDVIDSAGFGHHQPDPHTSTSEKHASHFAKELAEYLHQQRAADAFTSLIIAAEPQFLGRLRKNLDRPTAHLVAHTIDKNWIQHDAREIEQLLEQQL